MKFSIKIKVTFVSLLILISVVLLPNMAPKALAQSRVVQTSKSLPNPVVTLTFTPYFIPVQFAIDSNGNISVGPSINIPVLLGVVTLSATQSIPLSPQVAPQAQQKPMSGNSLLLIIRHKQGTSLQDDSYLIQASQSIQGVDIQGSISEVSVKWTGTGYMVWIDASKGNITNVALQGISAGTVATPKSGCPSATMVAWSMNLDPSSVQQISGPCSFQWNNNPGTNEQINAQCDVGYGPNSVVLTFTDWFHSIFDQGATTACDGHNATAVGDDINDAASATITF